MRVAALHMFYLGFIDDIGLQLHSCRCINVMHSYRCCNLFLINSTPKKSQTAGFGVFAGRSFKQDEAVLQSWMTMFLPRNIAQFQDVHNYAFEYNETHLVWISVMAQ